MLGRSGLIWVLDGSEGLGPAGILTQFMGFSYVRPQRSNPSLMRPECVRFFWAMVCAEPFRRRPARGGDKGGAYGRSGHGKAVFGFRGSPADEPVVGRSARRCREASACLGRVHPAGRPEGMRHGETPNSGRKRERVARDLRARWGRGACSESPRYLLRWGLRKTLNAEHT